MRRLAVGGMAEVFLAESSAAGEGAGPVVVKRLLPGADETHARLFERERSALSCIASPHVVRFLGSSPGVLFLEFVDGPDLATLLRHQARRGHRMPLGAAMAVLEGIFAGLADLHDARDAAGRPLGAVHRDLNPSNVLVSRDGDVKIADLGVVHLEIADLPTVAGMKGTLAYMAPEQLLGRPVDPRTDLYAAGLVAYEVLAGVPARPAGMSGISELMEARSRLPIPPSAVRPDLPKALDAVVLGCLAPRPEDRPADARACLAGLRTAAGIPPDRAGLARAARSVDGPAVRSAATVTVGTAEEGPVQDSTVRYPPSARESRWSRVRPARWAAALVAVVTVLAASWLSLSSGADTVPADAAAVGIVAGASNGGAPAAPTEAVPPEGAVSRPPRVLASVDQATGVAPGRLPEERRHPATAVPAIAAAAPPAGLRVEVRAVGNPVHVAGAGARGLAPRLTDDLPQGSSLLTLHGDVDGLPPALVRLVHSGNGLTATIGTGPDRHFNRIRCGGRDVGETSAVGIPIEGETRCDLAADEGTLAFSLVVVRR